MLNFTRITPGVRALLVVLSVASVGQWLLLALGHVNLLGLTALSGDALQHGQLWRALTYPGSYSNFASMQLLFDGLLLYFFGTGVEAEIGTRRFYRLFLACTLGGALGCLVGSLAGVPDVLRGATVAIVGIELTYCWLFAQEVLNLMIMFVLPVRIKAAHLGALVLICYLLAFPHHIPAFAGSLLAGYLALRYKWGAAQAAPRRFGQAARKSRLASVSQLGSKVTQLRPIESVPSKLLSASEREVDRILDKLRDEGKLSLTPAEQETLDFHSRQLRQRDGV